MAVAVPSVPFTEGGGVAWPNSLLPQQMTFPVPAWIAQLWSAPAETAVAVPVVPVTDSGGNAWPKKL